MNFYEHAYMYNQNTIGETMVLTIALNIEINLAERKKQQRKVQAF